METSRRGFFGWIAGLVWIKPKINPWGQELYRRESLRESVTRNDYQYYAKGTSAWSKDHTGQWRRWVFTDDVRIEK